MSNVKLDNITISMDGSFLHEFLCLLGEYIQSMGIRHNQYPAVERILKALQWRNVDIRSFIENHKNRRREHVQWHLGERDDAKPLRLPVNYEDLKILLSQYDWCWIGEGYTDKKHLQLSEAEKY